MDRMQPSNTSPNCERSYNEVLRACDAVGCRYAVNQDIDGDDKQSRHRDAAMHIRDIKSCSARPIVGVEKS